MSWVPPLEYCSQYNRKAPIKATPLIGISLMVLGVISVAYQGIAYTTHRKILDIGPILATTERKTIAYSQSWKDRPFWRAWFIDRY